MARRDRVELAYKALVKGEGVATDNIVKAIQESYDNEKTDEFVIPAYLEKDGKPYGRIQDKDSIIFFNFRLGTLFASDRSRERIQRAASSPSMTGIIISIRMMS